MGTIKPQPGHTTAGTILVVEDEKAVADILFALLEGEGFEVLSADSGAAGLAHLRGAQPDLILSDVMMPELDGVSMCCTIQHNPAYNDKSDIPVVLMSAEYATVSRYKCRYEAFVPKPFDVDQLLDVVHAVLNRGSA